MYQFVLFNNLLTKTEYVLLHYIREFYTNPKLLKNRHAYYIP